MKESAATVIETLRLEPHKEGGWFRRTYESDRMIEFSRGNRPCGSSILYLLKKGEVSRLHYLRSDETWYFHCGNPVELHSFSDGKYECAQLGCGVTLGEVPQVTLPAETVFGANSLGTDEWSLVSCSVSPGFDYADFFWPDVEQLIRDFPVQKAVIRKLACLQ
jgi:predicted cupin superfamily sugar epimerase